MQKTIVVFGSDEANSENVRACLQKSERIQKNDVSIVKVSEFGRYLSENSQVDILLVSTQASLTLSDSEHCDGIDIAQKAMACSRGTQVVLYDVHTKDLMRACELQCTYLLPYTADEKAFERAVVFAQAQSNKWRERPLVVHTRKHDWVISPKQVRYIESNRRKAFIHMDGTQVEAYVKLSDLLDMLPQCFVQCHKSFLVNMSFVKEVSSEHILLVSGECVPVSQKRRTQTRELFASYVDRTLLRA